MSITEEVQAQARGRSSGPGPSGSKRGSSKKRESAFHGVRKRSWGRYVSEIRLPGQKTRIWLGSFGSAEMAARAYDSAAFFLKGTSASLNFPEQVESLPRPLSSSRRDIQSAAAKAALQLPSSSSSPPSKTTTDNHNHNNNNNNNPMEMMNMEWWDQLGQEDDSVWTTTSFPGVQDAPLMSPLRVGSTFGDLTWNEVFNFNDDILAVASAAPL